MARRGRGVELWGIMGNYGKFWGIMGELWLNYGDLLGIMTYWELWGFMRNYGEW